MSPTAIETLRDAALEYAHLPIDERDGSALMRLIPNGVTPSDVVIGHAEEVAGRAFDRDPGREEASDVLPPRLRAFLRRWALLPPPVIPMAPPVPSKDFLTRARESLLLAEALRRYEPAEVRGSMPFPAAAVEPLADLLALASRDHWAHGLPPGCLDCDGCPECDDLAYAPYVRAAHRLAAALI